MDFVRMDRNALPPKEHEAAWSIEQNLMALVSNAEEFRQTADLYLFAHTQKLMEQNRNSERMWEMIGWIKIAGRNGTIVAYSFSRLMEAINATRAPTIWSKADLKEKRKATKLFANEFPKIAHVRQSAAHPGELTKNPTEQQRHTATKGIYTAAIQAVPGSQVFISGMMQAGNDRLRYGGTFEGEYVEYELSIQKAEILNAVADSYHRTFYPLEEPNAAQQREWMRESDLRLQQDQSSRPPWWHSLLRP